MVSCVECQKVMNGPEELRRGLGEGFFLGLLLVFVSKPVKSVIILITP